MEPLFQGLVTARLRNRLMPTESEVTIVFEMEESWRFASSPDTLDDHFPGGLRRSGPDIFEDTRPKAMPSLRANQW